ncbi:MAG: hypothetical protein AB1589_39600 [Cyanobacteriota bacterium]
MKSETIQSITPLFLGVIAGAIAIAAIFAPDMTDVSRAAAFGFANAAIAGASGLAQNKSSDSATVQGKNVSIESIQKEE